MRSMKVLCVNEGKLNKDIETKDIVHGKKLSLKKSQKMYFVNTVFSQPNSGFAMTADGKVFSKTDDCKHTKKELAKLTKEALKKVENGQEGELGLAFEF